MRPSPDVTWELLLEDQASVKLEGFGCNGSSGRPVLEPLPGHLPWVADSYKVEVSNLTSKPFEPAIGVLGFSDRLWGAQVLPLDLIGLGAPGCRLLTSIDKVFPLSKLGGRADWELHIPNLSTLTGLEFHLQVLLVDFSANDFGVTVSNGLSQTIGSR